MKQSIRIRLLVLSVLFIGTSQSYHRVYENDYRSNECCAPVYDCGDPLICGSLNFWLRAGVAPTLWRNRGNFSLVSCNALAIPGFGQTVIDVFELPKFKKFFKTPWIVGGQIGYALSNHFEIYLEFNYRSARSREFTLENITIPNDTVNVLLNFDNHYRVFDAYVGGRYYTCRWWCDRVAFFIGAKFGLVHHKSVCFNFNITPLNCPIQPALSSNGDLGFFFKNTVPASGLNIGLDWCVGCGWSVMLMGEVVASCGPKSNQNIITGVGCPNPALPAVLPSNIIIGHIGTELFFPVTLGLKYSF